MSLHNGQVHEEHVNEINECTPSSIRKNTPTGAGEHYNPSVRLLKIEKSSSEACGLGFHLTRSKWDPYPWVSAVDATTPAELSGLKAGDCILEVNGEDVLGLRIKSIAKLVKAKSEHVTLLLWSTGMDANCDPESLCCGPMPLSLQRLSVIMQNILSIIECPVCLDTIPPPAMQCQNGHLLCVKCRIRAEKCPVCRDRYTPRRALIAEQIYNAITNAFNLCNNEDKLRQKLFGPNAKQMQAEKEITNQKKLPTDLKANQSDADSMGSPSIMPRNKFLAKLWGKACSMDNLASSSSMLSNGHGLMVGTSTPALLVTTAGATARTSVTATTKLQSATNQLLGTSYASNHVVVTTTDAAMRATGSSNTLVSATTSSCITSPISSLSSSLSTSATTLRVPRNNVFEASSTLKHFSLSTNDLSLDDVQIAIERCPSMHRLSDNSRCRTNIAAPIDVVIDGDGVGTLGKPFSPLFLDSRRPSSSLNSSVECIQKGLGAIDTTAELNTNLTSTLLTTKYSSSPSPSTSTAISLQLKSSGSDIKNDLINSSSATTALSSSSSSPSPLPSTKSSLSASPVLLATTKASSTDIPVATCTSPPTTFGDNLMDYQLLKPVDCIEELTSKKELLKSRFCCPFNCGKRFAASSKLQRHVKVDHQKPILCVGSSSVKLALPLQRPLHDAVLLLEIENDGNVRGNQNDADADDKHVRNDDKRHTKECWIRLQTSRKNDLNGCRIYASALLQGSDDECIDFMLETEVACQQLDDGEENNQTITEKNKNDSKNVGIDENKKLKPQQQQPLLTRSIVHSMETTTWQELLASINGINNNINSNNNNDKNMNHNAMAQENFDSNDKKIKDPTNKNNEAEHWLHGNGSLSSKRNPNDLSVISVIFQSDQNGVKHGQGSEAAEMVLNINVRRRTEAKLNISKNKEE